MLAYGQCEEDSLQRLPLRFCTDRLAHHNKRVWQQIHFAKNLGFYQVAVRFLATSMLIRAKQTAGKNSATSLGL